MEGRKEGRKLNPEHPVRIPMGIKSEMESPKLNACFPASPFHWDAGAS
jgi:hypothetical protein